jgi:hypothetical protein
MERTMSYAIQLDLFLDFLPARFADASMSAQDAFINACIANRLCPEIDCELTRRIRTAIWRSEN